MNTTIIWKDEAKLLKMLKNIKRPRIMPTTKEPIQSDPNGKLSNESGAKLDANKNRIGLVLSAFAPAIEQVCTVGTLGANKYSDNGWITVPKGINRYTDAMLRHYIKECQGEILDPELTEMNNGKEVYHAACVAWNALARLTLIIDEINGKEKETWRKVDEPS